MLQMEKDPKPCGRGHHKRRKKGSRSHFDRRKNDERHRQEANKENTGTSEHVVATSSLNLTLPKQWQVVGNSHYCKMEIGCNRQCEVTRSLIVDSDHTWIAYVGSKKIPETCSVLSQFSPPTCISTSDDLLRLIKVIDEATLCPGNPDEKFITICQARGGKLKGAGGAGDVAFIDASPVVDTTGKVYDCTVRRIDCELLCERSGQYPLRCNSCQPYRSTLRSAVSRQKVDSTSASSHTPYSRLTLAEKDERMRNLQQAVKLAKQKAKRMEEKVTKLIESQALPLHQSDQDDLSSIITDVHPVVEESFPPHSPQRVFWDQQRKYNNLKDKRQMRWHPLMVRFALNLKYLSGSAYRAVRQSGVIALPSDRTLSDYTHWMTPRNGVQLEFVEQLLSLLTAEVSCGQYHCALSMDEMKLKSGLVFNKHTGLLCGFVDLGSVNQDIELAVSGTKDESSTSVLAEQAFVFLARAIFKPSLSVPVAHYCSANLKGTTSALNQCYISYCFLSIQCAGERIFPLAWEVVEALEMYDIPVVSLISDGAKPNRRFYRLCQHKSKTKAIPYKAVNPYREEEELYYAPHLLKTARNCFSNSYAHSRSRNMMVSST